MSIIAAGTTTTTALSSTGNTDGTLQFQVNGTTPSVTLNTLGAIGVGSSPSYGTSGQVLTSAGSTAAPSWSTNVSSQWTTTGSDIYYNTGNVGIGTSSPAQALHVVSTGNQIKYPIRLQNDGTSGITLGTGQQFYVYNGTSVANNGTIIATGSTWSYGTYSANQFSISAVGSGGVRVATASAPITFHTGNADSDLSLERMRLDSAGNLGIGVTPSAWNSTKKAIQIGNRAAYWSDSNVSTTVSNNTYVDAVGYKYLETAAATFYNQNAGVNSWWTAASGTAGAAITFTQVMTLSNAGGLSVGTTADPGAGAIYATGNITAYYSSDIKFKENVRDIPDALATVNAIGGKLFDWTDEYIESKGGADGYFVQKADFGVVAQDVQKVFPIAVRTREDGSLAVDYEKLGALAFAALVELTKRVEALEAK